MSSCEVIKSKQYACMKILCIMYHQMLNHVLIVCFAVCVLTWKLLPEGTTSCRTTTDTPQAHILSRKHGRTNASASSMTRPGQSTAPRQGDLVQASLWHCLPDLPVSLKWRCVWTGGPTPGHPGERRTRSQHQGLADSVWKFTALTWD